MQRPHTKRQATQHGCLPRLLGNGVKGIEIVYGEDKNILYWADYSSQGTTGPTNQLRKEPFHLSPLSPHSPQFPYSAEATPL